MTTLRFILISILFLFVATASNAAELEESIPIELAEALVVLPQLGDLEKDWKRGLSPFGDLLVNRPAPSKFQWLRNSAVNSASMGLNEVTVVTVGWSRDAGDGQAQTS